MSADNWTVCPRCRRKVLADAAAKELAAREAYGNVPQDEYIRLLSASNEKVYEKRTLGEDYEIGIGLGGDFYVDYRASCGDCGYQYEYKFTAPAGASNA